MTKKGKDKKYFFGLFYSRSRNEISSLSPAKKQVSNGPGKGPLQKEPPQEKQGKKPSPKKQEQKTTAQKPLQKKQPPKKSKKKPAEKAQQKMSVKKPVEKEKQSGSQITTDFDRVLLAVRQHGKIKASRVRKELSMGRKQFRGVIAVLEKNKAIIIRYPALGSTQLIDMNYEKNKKEKKKKK